MLTDKQDRSANSSIRPLQTKTSNLEMNTKL